MNSKLKKSGILLSFVAIVLLAINSCSKSLDQIPATSKELSNFLKTENEVEEYVNAVYGLLQVNGTYGLYFPALAEIPSDNTFDEVPANDGQVYGQLDEFATIPGNGLITAVWKDHYRAIQSANVVLNRIGEVPFQNENLKSVRIGEMQFLRALLYFNLVRSFGDVPLVTQETVDPNAYFGQGRTPQDQVYAQIVEDLASAAANLPLNAEKPGQATKQAANTLLGKVQLALGDLEEAKKYLMEVVNSKKYDLVSIDQVFDIEHENNEEIIFDVQFASGLNGNTEGSSMQQQFSPSGTLANAKGHNLPTKSLYDLYTDADLRKEYYVGLTPQNIPYCKKLARPTTAPADGGSNFVVLRYADVLLMLAEIENETGNTGTAADYLNQVRNRADLGDTEASTPAELSEAIELERRLELICEGHRWFDLIRYGKAVEVMNAWFEDQGVSTRIDEEKLVMPIPQGQVDTDPSIIQNPGY